MIAYRNDSFTEISYSQLKRIRKSIEERTANIYVDITRVTICSTVNIYSNILRMDDTKITIYKDIDSEQIEYFKERANEIPPQYLSILKETMSSL
ncbi:hypothetical protein [Dysgonomonas reticulitermitis]